MKRPREFTLERVKGERKASQSFTTPAEGSIYMVLWKTRYYAVVVLTLGDFGSIGLTGSIWETGLWKICPEDHSYNEHSGIIYKKQNCDANARFQQYPVKYFGRTSAPTWYGWVEAEQLKPLRKIQDGKLVHNYFMAMRFSAWRETTQAYTRAAVESKNSATQAASMSKICDGVISPDPRCERPSETDGDDDSNDGGDDDSDAGDSNYETEDESSVTDDDYTSRRNKYEPQVRKRLQTGSVVCPTRQRRYTGTTATVPYHSRPESKQPSCCVPLSVDTSKALKTQAGPSDARGIDGRPHICITPDTLGDSCNHFGSIGVAVESCGMESVQRNMSSRVRNPPDICNKPATLWITRSRVNRITPLSNCIFESSVKKKSERFQGAQFSIAGTRGNAEAVKEVAISTSHHAPHHKTRSHLISKATRSLEQSVFPSATTALNARMVNAKKSPMENVVTKSLTYNQQSKEADTRKSREPHMKGQAIVSEDLSSGLGVHTPVGQRCCIEDMPGCRLLEILSKWRSNGDLDKIMK